MNIFILEHRNNDTLPIWCTRIAKSYCNEHVNKIISELRQMLEARTIVSGMTPAQLSDSKVKKPGYWNHPCSVWLSTCVDNWVFGVELAKALDTEAKKRSGRVDDHKDLVKIINHFSVAPSAVPAGPVTAFAKAMPDSIAKRVKCPVEAYRAYYATYKSWFARAEVVDKQHTGKYLAVPSSWTSKTDYVIDEPEWFERVSVRRAILSQAITVWVDVPGRKTKKQMTITSKDQLSNYEQLMAP